MKRTIIITGGTTGIGKATAYQFAKNGWNVVITSRSEKKGNAFVEEAKNEGLDMTFFQLDVTNEEQVAKVIDLSKQYVMDSELTINQVAYKLGFQYPQHFTRLFKKEVGVTPSEYRLS